MGLPDLTRMINDIQRSNVKNKGICEAAVIEHYKVLGKAAALKDATTGVTVRPVFKVKPVFVAAVSPARLAKSAKDNNLFKMTKAELYTLATGDEAIEGDGRFESYTRQGLMRIIKENTQ